MQRAARRAIGVPRGTHSVTLSLGAPRAGAPGGSALPRVAGPPEASDVSKNNDKEAPCRGIGGKK